MGKSSERSFMCVVDLVGNCDAPPCLLEAAANGSRPRGPKASTPRREPFLCQHLEYVWLAGGGSGQGGNAALCRTETGGGGGM